MTSSVCTICEICFLTEYSLVCNTYFSSKDMLMRVIAQDLSPGSTLVEKVNFTLLSPLLVCFGYRSTIHRCSCSISGVVLLELFSGIRIIHNRLFQYLLSIFSFLGNWKVYQHHSFFHITKTILQVMTPNPECATVDTPIVDALHTMHDGKFLHLPVVDKGIPA